MGSSITCGIVGVSRAFFLGTHGPLDDSLNIESWRFCAFFGLHSVIADKVFNPCVAILVFS
jgi:hypothetical protein